MNSGDEQDTMKIHFIPTKEANGVGVHEEPNKDPNEGATAGNEQHHSLYHGMTEEEMHTKMAQKEVSVSAVRAAKEGQVKVFWTQDNRFTLMIGVVILFNAVVLGVEADYGKQYKAAFGVIEHLLTAIFLLELIAHFVVEGFRIYFADPMNWLDCSLVLMSVIDVWIIRSLGIKADLRIMSVLRMLRLTRLARLLKLVRMFKELTLLVTGFLESIRTLTWALLFLLSVVYVFAIFARQMIGDAHDCTDREMDEWGCDAAAKPLYIFNKEVGSQASLFGAVDRSMLTLFVCLTEGCGIDIVHPTVLKSPALIIFWGIFIFFTTYGLLNLIVGVFCEHAMKTAADNEKEFLKSREEHRKHALRHMRAAFEHMDNDGSGSISNEEYHTAVTENEEVMEAFSELQLDAEENLFETLDAEKAGHVTFDQFFDGVTLVMKGHESAKAKDMVGTHLICAAIARRAKKIEADLSCLWHKDSDLVGELKLIRGIVPDNEELQNMKLELEESSKESLFLERMGHTRGAASTSHPSHVQNVAQRSVEALSKPRESPSPAVQGLPTANQTNSGAAKDSRCLGTCSGDANMTEMAQSSQQQTANSGLYMTFQKILDSTEALRERLENVESQLELQGQQIQKLSA